MGYTHLTDISQFIPPSAIQKTAGTWTPTLGTNLFYDVRTAADAEFSMIAPIPLPGSEVGLQGARSHTIDVWYRISGTAADDFAVVSVINMNLRANELAVQGAAVPITLDAAHDSATKRKTSDHHKMTISIDAPFFIQKNRCYHLVMTVDGHANTAFWLYGCQVNMTLRL